MLRQFLLPLIGLLCAVTAVADQVELTDGTVIKGRILTVTEGAIKVETEFVGTLSVALENVRTFATDEPVNVSVAGEPAVLAPVEVSSAGVRINEGSQALETEPAQVTELWRSGSESPGEKIARHRAELAARKWSYEGTIALTGRTGTSEKLNATVGGTATLASDHDRLILTATAERAEDSGKDTANRKFGGADYSSFRSPELGWYVRSSLEEDQIKSLDLRSASAFGVTRKVIRESNEELELRLGASYTLEQYTVDADFSSPGLDFTVLNSFTRGEAKLNTVLAYVPTFRDTTNYRLRHESNLEIPLTISQWKLKVGVTNEYQNVPASGVERFNTTYFTSLLLNWK